MRLIRIYSLDLTLPVNGSIDRDDPAWTSNLLDLYIETIDVFSKYNNMLAYNIGNEVVTAPNETNAAPFIKAAARDIKAYLSVHGFPILSNSTHANLVFLEIPNRHLRSLAIPQSMVIPHGLSRLQATSLVILQEVTLAVPLSISSVSTISGCRIQSAKTTFLT